MTRYFATAVGLLTAEEYHAAFDRWPACLRCGTPNLEGEVDEYGLCHECDIHEATIEDRNAEADYYERGERNREIGEGL